jgi:hypothetical protein
MKKLKNVKTTQTIDVKGYIDNINYKEAYFKGERCVVLDVQYRGTTLAQYCTGRDYLTKLLGDDGEYIGTPQHGNHRQFWYKFSDPSVNTLMLKAKRLSEIYDGEIPIAMPPAILKARMAGVL